MRRSTAEPPAHPSEPPSPDWVALYPADPELMSSVEGDRKGLIEVQRAARARREVRATDPVRDSAGEPG
jgi:hypothetical protein